MASNFRELIAWQKAMDLAQAVYGVTAGWPKDERFGLVSQAQRSAVSVASNIAEGHERRTTREYLRFLAIAAGSLAELETQLLLAQRIRYSSPTDLRPVLELTHEVGRIVRAIERSLGNASGPATAPLSPEP